LVQFFISEVVFSGHFGPQSVPELALLPLNYDLAMECSLPLDFS